MSIGINSNNLPPKKQLLKMTYCEHQKLNCGDSCKSCTSNQQIRFLSCVHVFKWRLLRGKPLEIQGINTKLIKCKLIYWLKVIFMCSNQASVQACSQKFPWGFVWKKCEPHPSSNSSQRALSLVILCVHIHIHEGVISTPFIGALQNIP